MNHLLRASRGPIREALSRAYSVQVSRNCPPPPNVLKATSDGSYLEKKEKAGAAYFFTDTDSAWIDSKYVHLPDTFSSYAAEGFGLLLALLRAPEINKRYNYRLWFQSDNESMVQAANNFGTLMVEYYELMVLIRQQLQSLNADGQPGCILTSVKGTGNKLVDALAGMHLGYDLQMDGLEAVPKKYNKVKTHWEKDQLLRPNIEGVRLPPMTVQPATVTVQRFTDPFAKLQDLSAEEREKMIEVEHKKMLHRQKVRVEMFEELGRRNIKLPFD